MDQTTTGKDAGELMRRAAVGAAVLTLTLLSFFHFPGHTYLQSDTQIYIPILEHLWDSSVLAKDLIVERPHVAYTLYDEVAIGLRKVTGLGFEQVLQVQQLVTRALGIFGLYLAASAFGLPAPASLLCAALVALGATVSGPAVLSFEYEPVPRGFAVALIYFAIGLAAQGKLTAAAWVAAAATLYHAPAAIPFWMVFGIFAWRKLLPLAVAALILWVASRLQAGPVEPQRFFGAIDPALEALQRMRASYNWISAWWTTWLPHYAILWAAALLATARLWLLMPRAMRFFAVGLPLVGILSVLFSYLTLDVWKWALMPQVQPMRALLFVTVMTGLLAAVAGCQAVTKRRWREAFAWFALAYLIPMNATVTVVPSVERIWVVAALAAGACLTLWRWEWVALSAAAAAFFMIPVFGNVRNYPALHTPELEALSHWARVSTPKGAVFLFPDAARDLAPGIFRARALRAVYVDWKGGGQVNYHKKLADTWWSRWQAVMAAPYRPRGEPIDYLVYRAAHRDPRLRPAFANDRYVVYHTAEFSRVHGGGDAAAAAKRPGGDVGPGVGAAAGSGPSAKP